MTRSTVQEILDRAARSYAVMVLLGLVVAMAVGPAVGSLATPTDTGPKDAVAVVPIDGTITTSRAEAVAWDLREVRRRDEVKAVVLQVNSPGGSAAASEQLYVAVRRTAAEMPVVVSVENAAASGAYYASVPADDILVTPASIVGSVGVRASYPSGGFGQEITTGPDKNTGGTAAEARARVETIQRAFVGTVMAHRGDRLAVSRQEVANAKVYAGARAVEHGFADRVGVLDDAIATAAAHADLDDYRVLHTRLGSGDRLSAVTEGNPARPVTDARPFAFDGVETTTYLMLWGQVEDPRPAPGVDAAPSSGTTQPASTATGSRGAPSNSTTPGEVTADGG